MKRYDWSTVVESLVLKLTQAKFDLIRVDDGGEDITTRTVSQAVEAIVAVDEATLIVRGPDGRRRWLLLVLGNEPHETVSDYSWNRAYDQEDDPLEPVLEDFQDEWEDRKCPVVA